MNLALNLIVLHFTNKSNFAFVTRDLLWYGMCLIRSRYLKTQQAPSCQWPAVPRYAGFQGFDDPEALGPGVG